MKLAKLEFSRKTRRLTLMIVGPVVLVAAGSIYWVHSKRYEDTDNAYIVADQGNIAAQVSGRVISVPVEQNQAVTAGQLLLEINPAPFRIALAQAQANLSVVTDKLNAIQASYRAAKSELVAARANAAYLQREARRKHNLVKKNVVSAARYDDLNHELQIARAKVNTITEQIQQTAAQLGGNPDLPLSQQALYRQAMAAIDKAKLELSYTRVLSPAAGVVAKVNLKPGDVIRAGQPVFALIFSGKRWVEANFKETQLTHIKVGQMATVSVDSYPGHEWHGRVVSISPGTGAVFSVLPAENATGNWVKVVQRIPVRILLQQPDDGPDLRAGMSAEVSIDTGYKVLSHLLGGDKN